jgi:6-phosphogluconolactonase
LFWLFLRATIKLQSKNKGKSMANYLYIASRSKDGGIYKYYFNGKGYELKGFFKMDSPMYMIAKNNKMHVLLREPFSNGESGYLNCDVNANGDLLNQSQIISTKGKIACHLLVDGKEVYVANYTSGSVAKIPDVVVCHKGEKEAHTHYVNLTPDGKYILVTDLGLDGIFLYDKNLQLKNKFQMPTGHGVRHLCFGEDGIIFSANELKSTVCALKYQEEKLTLIDTISCLPSGIEGGNFASAIRIYKGDIFVAVRGCNLISRLSFDGQKLKYKSSFTCEGKTPRDFYFDENRLVCCNQESDLVTIFEEKDGQFNLIQKIELKEPICVLNYKTEE